MTDLQPLVAPTYTGLADLLSDEPVDVWDTPSLCQGWRVRHVVAHVTMPARLTPEAFAREMAAARGDFTLLSETVAARDASRPLDDLLGALRSPLLHEWQPPGGGSVGALSHALIHSLDVTLALRRAAVAPQQALVAIADQLVDAGGAWFGVDPGDLRLEAADHDWARGVGEAVRADLGSLVSLLSGRTLPDGRALPRR